MTGVRPYWSRIDCWAGDTVRYSATSWRMEPKSPFRKLPGGGSPAVYVPLRRKKS